MHKIYFFVTDWYEFTETDTRFLKIDNMGFWRTPSRLFIIYTVSDLYKTLMLSHNTKFRQLTELRHQLFSDISNYAVQDYGKVSIFINWCQFRKTR